MRGVHSLHPPPLRACFFTLAQNWEAETEPQTPLQTAGPPARRNLRVSGAWEAPDLAVPPEGTSQPCTHAHTHVHTCFPSQLYFFTFNKVPHSSPSL